MVEYCGPDHLPRRLLRYRVHEVPADGHPVSTPWRERDRVRSPGTPGSGRDPLQFREPYRMYPAFRFPKKTANM